MANRNKRNKVLFIAPRKTCALNDHGEPVQKLRCGVSLPALILLGALEKAGFKTLFMDLAADAWDYQEPLNGSAIQYGLPTNKVLDFVAQRNPRFILITSMFTFEQMVVDELVRAIKKSFPDIIVVLGGVHATLRPKWHLEESEPDFIVLGEGEETILELLTELLQERPNISKVRGIAFQNSQGAIEKTVPRRTISKLDSPWAYQSVLLKDNGEPRYIDRFCRKHPVYADPVIGEDIPSFALYSSRGCPTKCPFCPASYKDGCTIRHMGAETAFMHFKTVYENFGVRVFANQSDTLCVYEEDRKFLAMVGSYRRSCSENSFVFNNPNAFFLHLFFPKDKGYELDVEFLDLLVTAGFNTVTIAVETLIQRFNQKVDWSKIRPVQVFELCRAIAEKGLKSDVYMMFGFPEQTEDEFTKDVKFAETLQKYATFITWNGLTLIPGTRYYKEYIEKRLGGESEYRKAMRTGYAWHYPLEMFNVSRVAVEVFRDRTKPFGHPWI